MVAAFRRRPPPRRPVILLVVILDGVILVVDSVSIAIGIVVSSSLSLVSLHRPLILSLRQLVVACRLCRPIVLRHPRVLSSRWLVVACHIASVALSCCTALSSSRRTSWLLLVARLCRTIWLHRPLVLSSCRLVVACHVASVALSCCAALLSFCRSRRLCRPVMLNRLLVLSSRWLVVACRVVGLSSCAALSSSRRAGWLLLVASPLLPYHVAPPSRPLVVSADCYMSSCLPIISRGPLVLSSHWLVVTYHVGFVALLSWAAFPCLVRPIVSYCAALSSSC